MQMKIFISVIIVCIWDFSLKFWNNTFLGAPTLFFKWTWFVPLLIDKTTAQYGKMRLFLFNKECFYAMYSVSDIVANI